MLCVVEPRCPLSGAQMIPEVNKQVKLFITSTKSLGLGEILLYNFRSPANPLKKLSKM